MRKGLVILTLLIAHSVMGQEVLQGLMATSPGYDGVLAEQRVQNLVDRLKTKRSKSDIHLLRKVFVETHKKFLKNYSQYADMNEIFSSGNYDCLTATSMYSIVLDRLDFDYSIIETNYHIFIVVNTSRGEVLLETTDPLNGFVTDSKMIDQRIGNYKQNTVASFPANDKKFYLYDADFIRAHEKKLVEGRYILQCKVHDSNGVAHTMGVRNFNIWKQDSPAPEAKLGKFKIDYEIPAPEAGRLVHIRIEFMPHANKVRSAKIGFIQNVRIINSAGKVITPDSQSSRSERITPADWAIDRAQGKRSPYFGTDIGLNQKIIDKSDKIQLGKGGPNPLPAYMEDSPSTPGVLSFEACAIGMDTGEVFGCVTWGYSTLPDGKVNLMPRGFRDKPSAEFAEASAKWNAWITNSGKAGEKIILK